MRAFLFACLAILVVGGGGYFFLGSIQQSSGAAFATDGARIDPDWAWRSVSAGASETAQGECDTRKAWQWIFVDFGRPEGESATCSISQ
jgi:hypothetical protein